MSNHPSSVSRSRGFRKLWKPVLTIGTGGTTLAIWFEEIVAFAVEYIGVLFLPLLAGLIYLFNIYIFKSATPRADDIKKK
jgi:hypothetical protein